MPRWACALLAASFLLVGRVATAQEPAPETNESYQPTNQEWLGRNFDGQEPIRTAMGGQSNPRVSITRTPEGDVAVGQEITFDASDSAARRNHFYGGTRIENWVWDFGDGTQANAPIVAHTFDSPGVYHVTLAVHDETGWRGTRRISVVVGDAPCGQEPQEILIPTGDNQMQGYVTLPAGPGPFPTILEYGPYGPFPRGPCDDTIRNGYAYAHVSAPGRARSSGQWDLFGPQTQKGGYDAVEWLATKPWSSGRVGLWGVSGPAVGALLTAASSPPHLAAVVAKSSYGDLYRDIITAGGIPNSDTFVNAWLPLLTAQDLGAYGLNEDVVRHGVTNTERQIDLATKTYFDEWWSDRSIVDYASPSAPVLYYGNQRDLWPRASVEIARWITPTGGRVISVPGGHAFPDGSGWEASSDSFDLLAGESRVWFDHFLKGESNGVEERPPILTFTGYGGDAAATGFNFGRWEQLDTFPSALTEPASLFLRFGSQNLQRPTYHGLTSERPSADEPPALLVNSPLQGATSDDTGATLPQVAGLQESWETQSLVYETSTLDRDLRVNGPANLTFYARLIAPDVGFTAHVNDVWPDGSSHYISKGSLLASHRALDEDRSLFLGDGESRVLIRPYHPHTKEAAELLLPGQLYRFDIEIWGIHNVFKAGHRLRLVLAAQDLGWRTNATIGVAALVFSSAEHPSVLNLALLPEEASTNPFPYEQSSGGSEPPCDPPGHAGDQGHGSPPCSVPRKSPPPR